ncbi:T9SS type A sorting domain-containing protein, partial [bacterium]|nr:T9SS type A sorting domain-containing protein [bacterium]
GQHTVTFDASNLASGVYIYKIEAGERSLARKMLIVK